MMTMASRSRPIRASRPRPGPNTARHACDRLRAPAWGSVSRARWHPGPAGRLGPIACVLLLGLLVPGLACQSGPPPEPRDYYFSPRGDDQTGDGSSARPFRSVDRANRIELNPGDRLLFEGGQSFDGNLKLDAPDGGTPERPITVASYGRGRATLRAGAGTGVMVENVGGVRVADLVVVGNGPGANSGSGVEFRNALEDRRSLTWVRVHNVEARGFGRAGVLVHGCAPDGSASGYADVEIEGCAAVANKVVGVHVTGPWEGEPGAAPRALPHRDVRVRRCLAADNPGDSASRHENRSGSGILLEGVAGGLIESCEARGNGAANRAHHGGPVGIWCTVSDRIVIERCRSHRNRTGGDHDGGGFCLDGGVCNSVLRYNLSEENDGSGFGMYEYPWAPPASGNAIVENVSRNDGRKNGYAGIHVWDDSRALRHLRIERNRVVVEDPLAASAANAGGGEPRGRGDGWAGGGGARGAVRAKPPRGLWLQSPIRDAVIARNVFEVGAGARLMDVARGQRRVHFEGNVYRTGGDRIAVEWEGREFRSLRQWLAATGQAPDSKQINITDRNNLIRNAE